MSVFSAYNAPLQAAQAAQEDVTDAGADDAAPANIAPSIDALLRDTAASACPNTWAWYRAGEQLHLERQGNEFCIPAWPSDIAEDRLAKACAAHGWHAWPTGRGESVLGWLLAPVAYSDNAHLAELARTW